jgi:hypothetical protein
VSGKINGHLTEWIIPAAVSLAVTVGAGLIIWGKQDERIDNLRAVDLQIRQEINDLHNVQAAQNVDIALLKQRVAELDARLKDCEKKGP